AVALQQVADDGAVGAPAERQFLDDRGDAELLGEAGLQRRLTGPAAGDQRAVDVEQTDEHERTHSYETVSTTLPTSVPAPCRVFSSSRRCAAAASLSGSVLPIGGRSLPSTSQRLMSSAQRRCSAGVALNMAKPCSASPLT